MGYDTRVARGAVWLDERKPDWYTIIDLTWLDMERGEACILGQIAVAAGGVGYLDAVVNPLAFTPTYAPPSSACVLKMLSLAERMSGWDAMSRGFNITDRDANASDVGHRAWIALDSFWRGEILRRLESEEV